MNLVPTRQSALKVEIHDVLSFSIFVFMEKVKIRVAFLKRNSFTTPALSEKKVIHVLSLLGVVLMTRVTCRDSFQK